MSRYRFIRAQTPHYSVRRLCQVLRVGVASYYRWQQKVSVCAVPLLGSKPCISRFSPTSAAMARVDYGLNCTRKGTQLVVIASDKPCAGVSW